jgi:UDP-N-acetylmuramate dehydrogenase
MSNIKVDYNVSLKNLCTYGIGSTAKYLYHPKSNAELIEILKQLDSSNVRWYIIGSGSNVIFPDEPFDGALIKLDLMQDIIFKEGCVFVSSGVLLSTLINKMLDHKYVNLAPLMGIPGTVGGAIVDNAGSYGTDTFSNLEEIILLNNNYEIERIPSDSVRHGNRYSEFKGYNSVILGAKFKCVSGDVKEARKLINENVTKRAQTQPLEFRNAGSVFKNPEGFSAGALIEQCGLKGFRINDAMVSEKHANFIVNTRNATSKDIIELIGVMQDVVKKKKGIDLELEQIIIKW